MESTDKDAYTEALEAQALRQKITAYASGAVKYGNVDRDWANARLIQLGAEPVDGPARYQINTPITGSYGTTVTANSRAEALEKFAQYVANVADAGQVTGRHSCEGVYNVELNPDAGGPVFFSGPADPPETDSAVPGLDALKDGIRKMLKDGVTEQGWGHLYAVQALELMDLPALPKLVSHTVEVPVSGTTELTVTVFEGDDDDAVRRGVASVVAKAKRLLVVPDEIGEVLSPRSADVSLNLVDDEDDADDASF